MTWLFAIGFRPLLNPSVAAAAEPIAAASEPVATFHDQLDVDEQVAVFRLVFLFCEKSLSFHILKILVHCV